MVPRLLAVDGAEPGRDVLLVSRVVAMGVRVVAHESVSMAGFGARPTLDERRVNHDSERCDVSCER